MATAEQIKTLIKSHFKEFNELIHSAMVIQELKTRGKRND
jgi:hypothetical protein